MAQIDKSQSIKKSETYVHTHNFRIYRGKLGNEVWKILKQDLLDEFKNSKLNWDKMIKYQCPAQWVSRRRRHMRRRRMNIRARNKKVPKLKICKLKPTLSRILFFNQGQIIRYCIKENIYKPVLTDIYNLIHFINKSKTKKEQYCEIFKLLYKKYNPAQDEMDKLIFIIHYWPLTKYLLNDGFRISEHLEEKWMSTISIDHIHELISYGYIPITEKYLMNVIMQRKNIKFHLIKHMFEQLDSNGDLVIKNNKIINRHLNKFSIEDIKYLVNDKGLELTENCLDCAFPNIKLMVYLQEKYPNKRISETSVSKILYLKIFKKIKHNWKYNRYINVCLKKISKIHDYEKNIIKLLHNVDNQLLECILTEYMSILVRCRLYEIIVYLQKRSHALMPYICRKDISSTIYSIIRDDDIDSMKKMFEFKVIEPIVISTESYYLDYALSMESKKCIKYMHGILKMRCSINYLKRHHFYIQTNKTLQLLKILDDIGYPFTDRHMEYACKHQNIQVILFLMDKGCNIKPQICTYLFVKDKYKIIDFLLALGKIKYNTKNLIDQVIYRSYTISSRRYYCRKLINKRKINILYNKYGGAYTGKYIDKLMAYDCIDELVYLHKLCGIKINKKLFLREFHGCLNRIWTSPIISHKIISFDKKYNLGLFKNINKNRFQYITCKILEMYSSVNVFLKYIESESKHKYTDAHINMVIRNVRSKNKINKIKYLEDNGIKITINHFYSAVKCCRNVAEYFYKKYSFKITLHDIHVKLMNDVNCSDIIYIFKITRIKPTPYTVKLIVQRFLEKHYLWRLGSFLNFYKGPIMPETFENLNNTNNTRLKCKAKNRQIVNYEPRPDEIIFNNDVEIQRFIDQVH